MVSVPIRAGGLPGTITTTVVGAVALNARRGKPIHVHESHETWQAPNDLPTDVPPERSVTLRRVVGTDDLRRYLPSDADGLEGLEARAFQFGHALLARNAEWDAYTWNKYLINKLLLDRLQQTHDRFLLRLNDPCRFVIRRCVRVGDERSLLPKRLGKEWGRGRPWSIERLTQEGQHAAQAAGILRPTGEDIVAYGFTRAALLDPLRLEPDELRNHLRNALFDASRCPAAITSEQQADVRHRFVERLRRHLHEPTDRFNRWLSGKSSNLVKSIAQNGESLDRDVVVRGLLDLGWESFLSTAECTSAFFQAFARSLPTQLNQGEQHYFSAMYLPQAYLGGLPLVMIRDRLRLLRPILSRLWEDPCNETLVGALHRVLAYYAEVAPRFRELERRKKSGARARRRDEVSVGRKTGPSTSNQSAGGDGETKSSEKRLPVSTDVLPGLLADLVERRGVTCPTCRRTLVYSGFWQFDAKKGVDVEAVCAKHDSIVNITIPIRDIRGAMAECTDRVQTDH